MSARILMEGRFFGRLLVLTRCKNIGPHTAYLCLCKCGAQTMVRALSLRRGDTTSCGCHRSERQAVLHTTHGKYRTTTYNSWRAMLARCLDKKHPQFSDYGGRGITICEQWRSFTKFFADMGDRPEGTTLDRKNNEGNYESGNCQWATRIEQNRNKRISTKGEIHA